MKTQIPDQKFQQLQLTTARSTETNANTKKVGIEKQEMRNEKWENWDMGSTWQRRKDEQQVWWGNVMVVELVKWELECWKFGGIGSSVYIEIR